MVSELAIRPWLESGSGNLMPLSIPDKPFVGTVGKENSLAVDRREDRLICRVTRSSFWLIQIVLLLFGGALSAYLWSSRHSSAAPLPLPFMILAWVLTISCWLAFLRNLFGAPHLDLMYSTGEIRLFRRRSAEPWKKIQKNEMSGFEISQQFYSYRGRQAVNYLLSLLTVAGKRIPLCASTEEQMIRSLAGDFERITARKLETP